MEVELEDELPFVVRMNLSKVLHFDVVLHGIHLGEIHSRQGVQTLPRLVCNYLDRLTHWQFVYIARALCR